MNSIGVNVLVDCTVPSAADLQQRTQEQSQIRKIFLYGKVVTHSEWKHWPQYASPQPNKLKIWFLFPCIELAIKHD